VARYFLRLGAIAFGGPAAHVALMRRELVQQRRWVTDEEFMDLLGVTNLIPGPNSTEMSMQLGATRAGWRGLWLGGLCFIGPAVAIVLALAWAYVRWGATAAGEGLLFGIQPVILAVILQAIWGLRRAALKRWQTGVIAVAAAGLTFAGVNEILVLLGSGGVMVLPAAIRRLRRPASGLHMFVLGPLALAGTPAGYSLLGLFLVFLKIGAVLYGSGYVLLAFLQSDLVDSRGWLTQQQLLDAIAVGQFTPGPLFSSATFAGYVIDGWRGAAAATLGMFLPSFVFVAVTHPFVARLRRSAWAAPFLDGVNAAALALMAVVTFTLARETMDNAAAVGLFAGAAVVLVRFNPNSAWLVLAGACAGLLHAWLN
jgi:chromate transporter